MRVEEFMTKNVVTIHKNQRLSDALELMEKRRISSVFVVDEGGCCGVLTERDAYLHLGSSKHGKVLPTSLHVSTAMQPDPVTIPRGAEVGEAARLMLEKKVPSLLVSNGDEIEGVITLTDLLRCPLPSNPPLREVMRKEFLTASPSDRLVHARRQMLDGEVGRVVVVENENVVGILTEKDVARFLSAFRKAADRYQYNRVRNLLVGDVMTQKVFTLRPENTAEEASQLMRKEGISGIPILNDGRLVGLVTKRDLIAFL
jgi:CBS domain-containing protein